MPLNPATLALVEFVIGGTGRISGRGTAAMPEGDPRPWWPIAVHRVRVVKPGGDAFEADAAVELALILSGVEKMALVFPLAAPEDLPQGSRVTSLGWTPHPVIEVPPQKRGWRFWK